MRFAIARAAPMIALAAIALAGCQAGQGLGGGGGGAGWISRTHLGGPIARGEIRVEPATPLARADDAYPRGSAAIGRELARLGWTVATGNARSEQVAAIRVDQSRQNERVVTELDVRIQRRSDATVAWQGRGRLEARPGSPLAEPGAAVERLTYHLFQDFPGESGRTIRIR